MSTVGSLGAAGVVSAIAAAVVMFAGTNADDLVVLTVLNASARVGGRPNRRQIWAGQYLGFATLVAASMAAATGLIWVPGRWLWPFGLVPIAVGVHKLYQAVRDRDAADPAPPVAARGLTGVAWLTIVNGSDNLSVYTPVFRTSDAGSDLLTVAVFLVGVAACCLASSGVAAHPLVTVVVERWGRWIVPAVFIGIGVWVLFETGAFSGS